MKIKDELVKKVQAREACIEHTKLEEDLPLLKRLVQANTLGWDRYYYTSTDGRRLSSYYQPSGMIPIPLKDFFVEEVEESYPGESDNDVKDLIIHGITEGAEQWKSEALEWKAEYEKLLAQQKEIISFDNLVEYGKNNGANIVNGMPWSFNYKGYPVTHENDECYLIINNGTMRFEKNDFLITGPTGIFIVHQSKSTSNAPSPSEPVDKVEEEASGIKEFDELMVQYRLNKISLIEFASNLWNKGYNEGKKQHSKHSIIN